MLKDQAHMHFMNRNYDNFKFFEKVFCYVVK